MNIFEHIGHCLLGKQKSLYLFLAECIQKESVCGNWSESLICLYIFDSSLPINDNLTKKNSKFNFFSSKL